MIIDRDEDDHNYSWALYGQLDYDLTSKLTATAGFRYDYNNLAVDQMRPLLGVGDVARQSESGSWSPRRHHVHHLTTQALGYPTYSTGFRGGGFNLTGHLGAVFRIFPARDADQLRGRLQDELVGSKAHRQWRVPFY